MASTNPAVARLELAAILRQMRIAAGMSVGQAVDALMCSPASVSRLETGARAPRLRDVRDLCRLYGADEATTAALMDLTGAARRKDDLNTLSAGRDGLYPALVQAAATITGYAMDAIPALLRTAGYATQLANAGRPALEARLAPEYQANFTLDEAVLHRRIGSPAVMAAQLAHLAGLMEDGTVTVCVVPFDAGMPPLVAEGNFSILEFAGTIPPMAFAEVNGGYADRSGDLELYREMILACGERALSPAESLELIAESGVRLERQASKGR